MTFSDKKIFERSFAWLLPSLVILLEKTPMSSCLTARRGCITSNLLSLMEFHILINLVMHLKSGGCLFLVVGSWVCYHDVDLVF